MAWTYNAPLSGDTGYVATLTNAINEIHTAVDGKSPVAGPGSGQAFSTGPLTATLFATIFGVTASTPSGTPVILTTGLPGGVYLVSIPGIGGDCANYGASATVFLGSTNSRITANNAGYMTLTLGGGGIQATQTSGGALVIPYSITRIA